MLYLIIAKLWPDWFILFFNEGRRCATNLHLELPRGWIVLEAFVVIQVNSTFVIRRVVALPNHHIIVDALILRVVVCYGSGVVAVRVTEIFVVYGVQRMAVPVEFVEFVVVTMARLATVLCDAQAADHSVVFSNKAPLLVRQLVSNLNRSCKNKKTNTMASKTRSGPR